MNLILDAAATAQSDFDGFFLFERVPYGRYTIRRNTLELRYENGPVVYLHGAWDNNGGDFGRCPARPRQHRLRHRSPYPRRRVPAGPGGCGAVARPCRGRRP